MLVRKFAKNVVWRIAACMVVFGYVLAVSFLGQTLLRLDRDELIWRQWAAGTSGMLLAAIAFHVFVVRRLSCWKPERAWLTRTITVFVKIVVPVLAVVFFPVTIIVFAARRGRHLTPEQRASLYLSSTPFQ